MIKSLKSLLSDSVIYGLSGVITKMIGILPEGVGSSIGNSLLEFSFVQENKMEINKV